VPEDNNLHAGAPLDAWEARMKEIVREVLAESGMSVPIHVREENHLFLKECKTELIEFLRERQRARERWEKVRTNVIGGAILSAIGGVLSFLYWIGSLAMQTLSHPAATDAAQHLDKLPPR